MIKTHKLLGHRLSTLPLGKWLFSKMVGMMIPYTGTVSPYVLEVGPGRAKVRMKDKRRVRNHLKSFHALALANLGELSTGLAIHFAMNDNGRAILSKLEVEFLKKARGTITAIAETKIPETSFKGPKVVEAQLFDEKRDLVARVIATWLVDN